MKLLLIFVSTLWLLGCGSSSSGGAVPLDQHEVEEPTTPDPVATPDDPVSEPQTLFAQLAENNELLGPEQWLTAELNNPDKTIELQSDGFPNRIVSVQTSAAETISDSQTIAQLFSLYINPEDGLVKIQANQIFDYEQHQNYLLTLRLGSQDIKLNLAIFDYQDGSQAEPITLADYQELKSFLAGEFVNSQAEQEVLNRTLLVDNYHRVGDLYVQLANDIDASESIADKWQSIEFHGTFDGKQHVIKNLNIRSGHSFIKNQPLLGRTVLRNLGFVDARFNAPVIITNNLSSHIESVFITGKYVNGPGHSFQYAPFAVSGTAKNIYTNVYNDLTNLNANNSNLNSTLVSVSGLLIGGSSSAIRFDSGYANGSFVTLPHIRLNAQFQGLLGGRFTSVSQPNNSLAFSAINFQLTDDATTDSGVAFTQIGGLSGGNFATYPNDTDAASDEYRWRFVNQRAESGRNILSAIGRRDTDNDGVEDSDAFNSDLTAAGLSMAQLTQATQFAGPWLDQNSAFDIQQGEYPVLKNMPYPHVEGAVWMSAEDPGVAYQRHTFNDYLQDPDL